MIDSEETEVTLIRITVIKYNNQHVMKALRTNSGCMDVTNINNVTITHQTKVTIIM